MGEVWKGRDTRLDRTVAIKFSQAAFSDRFRQEARSIAALNHPNIATLYDVGPDYLVMEFLDGEPIKPPDDARRLLDIAVQIADGLAAAHAAGIIHRDLKPANILLTKGGRVKILDFGLAKQMVKESDATETIAAATDSGTIAGTAAYMSPEQARGQSLDTRSDQFSFGLVIFELAAGHRAFQRGSTAETLAAIIREEPPPFPESVPLPLRWTIERCLAKDPEARYHSTADLLIELRAMRDRLSLLSARVNTRPAGKPWLKPALLAVLAVALAILVIQTLRTPWRPDVSTYRIVPFANEDYPETQPSWSPDGRSIAYVAQVDGEYRIQVKGFDGAPPVVIATGTLPFYTLSWSPDGSTIYYSMVGGFRSVSRAGGASRALREFGGGNYSGGISPDGKSLAALATSPGLVPLPTSTRRLLIASPPGSTPKELPGFNGDCCFAPDFMTWSGDSRQILFSFPTDHGQELWVTPIPGKPRKLIESIGRTKLIASWFPGERFAVYSSIDQSGLRMVDTISAETSQLLPSSTASEPAVSRDGSRIAYTEAAARFSMVEIPVNGSPARPLLPSRLTKQFPAWAPASNEFLYVQGEEIRLHNVQTGLERVVVSKRDFPAVTGDIEFVNPIFAPDAKRIAYSLRTEQGGRIAISPVAGGAPAPLGDIKGSHYRPEWSPDGAWIAYASPTPENLMAIWKIRIGAGEKPVNLGSCTGSPLWSPDGSQILCSSFRLTLLSPDGKDTREVKGPYTRPAAWSRDGNFIYCLKENAPGKRTLVRLNWRTGDAREILDLPSTMRFDTGAGGALRFSLAPGEESLAGTVVAPEGDIWILDGLVPPRSLWERLRPW